MTDIQKTIEAAWENRDLVKEKATQEAVHELMEKLDKGALRVAELDGEGGWKVNQWR